MMINEPLTKLLRNIVEAQRDMTLSGKLNLLLDEVYVLIEEEIDKQE